MEGIRQYIVSVSAAAMLCTILREMVPSKGVTPSLLKLISGILLAFAVISPIKDISLENLTDYMQSVSAEGTSFVSEGENLSKETMAAIIKERTEAYILDKAAACHTDVTVEVTLSRDAVPVPESVRITGTVTPYTKSLLSAVMEDELGIAKERQTWIGQY